MAGEGQRDREAAVGVFLDIVAVIVLRGYVDVVDGEAGERQARIIFGSDELIRGRVVIRTRGQRQGGRGEVVDLVDDHIEGAGDADEGAGSGVRARHVDAVVRDDEVDADVGTGRVEFGVREQVLEGRQVRVQLRLGAREAEHAVGVAEGVTAAGGDAQFADAVEREGDGKDAVRVFGGVDIDVVDRQAGEGDGRVAFRATEQGSAGFEATGVGARQDDGRVVVDRGDVDRGQ